MPKCKPNGKHTLDPVRAYSRFDIPLRRVPPSCFLMWFPCVKLFNMLIPNYCFLQGTFSKCILFVISGHFYWLKWDPHKAYRHSVIWTANMGISLRQRHATWVFLNLDMPRLGSPHLHPCYITPPGGTYTCSHKYRTGIYLKLIIAGAFHRNATWFYSRNSHIR